MKVRPAQSKNHSSSVATWAGAAEEAGTHSEEAWRWRTGSGESSPSSEPEESDDVGEVDGDAVEGKRKEEDETDRVAAASSPLSCCPATTTVVPVGVRHGLPRIWRLR